MIDKGIRDKTFIWNPSNCECERDKSCDIGEYLDYENCKCRKKWLIKWLKNVLKTLMKLKWLRSLLLSMKINMKMSVNAPSHLLIVLFSIIFTISIGIGTYFIYDKYINPVKKK